MKIAYFDCFSGVSGDMILGALLDAGLPLETLESGLKSLTVNGYRLSSEKVRRASITATKLKVVIDGSQTQVESSLTDILKLIEASKLPQKVKARSSAVFQRLGEVEARLHGTSPEEVHFHELGAVDSIVDIVGVVFGFDVLGIERFYSSPLPVGSGNVTTRHGILPVPAPATLQLLALAHAPVVDPPDSFAHPGELVTPTGAVLVTSLASFGRPAMILEKVGYGAGTKDFSSWPNIFRLWLGEEMVDTAAENLILLETNIDDMNPQIYGYLMDRLFSQGAADVWFTPIQMKKNRPAVILSVLAPTHAEFQLTETIMRETSTLGIRVRPVGRHVAEREVIEFESSLGHVRAKVKRFMGDVVRVSPEYEDCRRIALERNIPLQEVYRLLENESRGHIPRGSNQNPL